MPTETPDTPSPLEARLVDLEVRFAFQERLLEELDGVLQEQARRIDRLEAALAELESRDQHSPEDDALAAD